MIFLYSVENTVWIDGAGNIQRCQKKPQAVKNQIKQTCEQELALREDRCDCTCLWFHLTMLDVLSVMFEWTVSVFQITGLCFSSAQSLTLTVKGPVCMIYYHLVLTLHIAANWILWPHPPVQIVPVFYCRDRADPSSVWTETLQKHI